VLGANDTRTGSDFQNARRFLLGGGQKGPHADPARGHLSIKHDPVRIITDEPRLWSRAERPRTARARGHAAHDRERWGFAPVVWRRSRSVGIVTVHDGPSLPPGEIIAPEVAPSCATRRLSQQLPEPEKIPQCGGYRGRQLQVSSGHLYHQPLFATVEAVPKT